MPQTPADPLVSAVVADRLGINRSTLTRWVKSGAAVPAGRLPGKTGAYLFSAEEVDRLCELARARAAA